MKNRISHRRRLRYLGAATLALLTSVAAAGDSAPNERILGRWVTETRNLEIDIAPCGAALCGTVTRAPSDYSMQDPNLRMKPVDPRPLLGMVVLKDFIPDGNDEWQGEFYNRENGKTFRCVLTPFGATRLRVRAYVGIPLLPQTQIWQRPGEVTATHR